MLSTDEFVDQVKQHQAGLRAFVRSLGVDPLWVDDVAQEVFVIAYRRREVFDESMSFRNWLWGIARHCVMNDRRKSARRQRLLHENLVEVLEATVSAESAPAMEVGEVDNRQLAALKRCLEEMPARSRELLRRRYEENEKATELAEELAMNPPAMRKSLERIRGSLRRCMEARLELEGSQA